MQGIYHPLTNHEKEVLQIMNKYFEKKKIRSLSSSQFALIYGKAEIKLSHTGSTFSSRINPPK